MITLDRILLELKPGSLNEIVAGCSGGGKSERNVHHRHRSRHKRRSESTSKSSNSNSSSSSGGTSAGGAAIVS